MVVAVCPMVFCDESKTVGWDMLCRYGGHGENALYRRLMQHDRQRRTSRTTRNTEHRCMRYDKIYNSWSVVSKSEAGDYKGIEVIPEGLLVE